jgi:hypothetical protein
MYTAQRPFELFFDPFERCIERRPSPDQNIVVTRSYRGRQQPHDLPEAPTNPIPFDRSPGFFGNGKSDARRACLATRPHL